MKSASWNEAVNVSAENGVAVRSSDMVQRQAWNCERCGSEGVIEYKTDSGCYEVFCAIRNAHAAKAPTCGNHSKIRVPLNDGDERPERA